MPSEKPTVASISNFPWFELLLSQLATKTENAHGSKYRNGWSIVILPLLTSTFAWLLSPWHLGMVGAGGIGYVISNSLQGYDYGTAGVAILLVFGVAYAIERLFVRIKKRFNS